MSTWYRSSIALASISLLASSALATFTDPELTAMYAQATADGVVRCNTSLVAFIKSVRECGTETDCQSTLATNGSDGLCVDKLEVKAPEEARDTPERHIYLNGIRLVIPTSVGPPSGKQPD